MVVAIDGPGGAGKSTVAGRSAELLGLPHLDTGATYRAATVAALRWGADPGDPDAVFAAVAASDIRYEGGQVWLDGEDITAATRSSEVAGAVSAVAAHPEVRRIIVDLQREWVGEHGGEAVVEGRDIGTVVFPGAAVKVFLTARPEIRAARRADEDPEALERRDRFDSSREASPLRAAEDALVIDTSDLSIEDVVATVVGLVLEDQH
ncbi:(d)CMP kinase [soil metagenome]